MATRISDTEKAAGQRADFHVYYMRNGKKYFDAIWAPTEEKARSTFLSFAKQLRWKVEITKVVAVKADA